MSRFREHPDSIAGRRHRRACELVLQQLKEFSTKTAKDGGRSWLDLTTSSTDAEVDEAFRNMPDLERRQPQSSLDLRTPAAIAACPLHSSWRLWSMHSDRRRFNRVSPSEGEVCAEARRAIPRRHRGEVRLAWEAAADDARYLPMTPEESGDVEWRYAKGSPSHLHSEAVVNGARIHIDHVKIQTYGPGSVFTEFRIFVNGRLRGRGGSAGCSLGAGGSDLPAVARVGSGLVLTVDDVNGFEEPVVELWEVGRGVR
jgi:hypothetical protein